MRRSAKQMRGLEANRTFACSALLAARPEWQLKHQPVLLYAAARCDLLHTFDAARKLAWPRKRPWSKAESAGQPFWMNLFASLLALLYE